MHSDSTQEENNHNLNKENYFKVPEGYFEKLQEDINGKIDSGRTAVLRKSPDMRRITLISGLAAAMVVVLLIFSFLIKKQNKGQNDMALFSPSEQSIAEYLEDNLDENTLWEASSNDISFFDADKLKEIVASDDSIYPNKENSTIEADTTLKKDEILDYLLKENIDPETL
ncbi:MAG: hypothetical protein WCL06_10965 [Bacteroidota bacterium]